jgi:hypothetical protein
LRKLAGLADLAPIPAPAVRNESQKSQLPREAANDSALLTEPAPRPPALASEARGDLVDPRARQSVGQALGIELTEI